MGGLVLRVFKQRLPGECGLMDHWWGGVLSTVDTLRDVIKRSGGSVVGEG